MRALLRLLGATDRDVGMLRDAWALTRMHARERGWLRTAAALVRGRR